MEVQTIHISKMSGKLDGLRAISTNTVSNDFCQKMYNSGNGNNICTKCYSNKMLRTYRKNTQAALQRNSDLLSKSVDDAVLKATRIMDAFLRLNAHGELINEQHLSNLVRLAELKTHTTFTLWTKRKNIIRQYFDRTFNNVLEHESVDQQNCTGQKCADCLLCYTKNDVKTIVEKVKKY